MPFNSNDDSHAHDILTSTIDGHVPNDIPTDGPIHVYVPPSSQTKKEKTEKDKIVPLGFPDTEKEKTVPGEEEKTDSTVPSSGVDSGVNDNDEANYQLMMNMLDAMTKQLSGIKKDIDATKKKTEDISEQLSGIKKDNDATKKITEDISARAGNMELS